MLSMGTVLRRNSRFCAGIAPLRFAKHRQSIALTVEAMRSSVLHRLSVAAPRRSQEGHGEGIAYRGNVRAVRSRAAVMRGHAESCSERRSRDIVARRRKAMSGKAKALHNPASRSIGKATRSPATHSEGVARLAERRVATAERCFSSARAERHGAAMKRIARALPGRVKS